MPSGIQLSETEQSYLKKACEDIAGFGVEDTYACIELSELILLKTGEVINYNTLRRILGVVKNSHSPSEYSLNIIAKFLGFDHWRHWQQHLHTLENERFLIKNHILTQHGGYSKTWIVDFVSRLEQVRWQDSYQLKSLIHAAVVNRDQPLMLLLTDLPVSLDDDLSMQRLYMSFESVIWEAMKSDSQYWTWVGEILIQRPVFRKVILEYYVNEAALDGYFGYWLNLPYTEVTKEFVLFRALLNGQLNFQKGVLDTSFKALITGIVESESWHEFHPIIQGRIAAWAVLFDLGSHEWLNTLCDGFESWYGKAAFTTFFYRLYWTFGSTTIYQDWNWRGEIPKSGMLTTFEYSQWNNYLVIQCVVAQLQDNSSLCAELMKQVDPYLFALDYFQWFQAQYNGCEIFVSEHE